MSKKQKCICSADLLSSVDKALNALDKSRKYAKKQKKYDKKAIAALLELEARIEDSGSCKCNDTKKKKSKKKSKAGKKPEVQSIAPAIGPKLAETLNSLGVHRFEQIANWQESDVERVDTHLNFSGRIARENWIEQAKALANGGRDEYVKVFGKEPR